MQSLPVWERGLKPKKAAPLVGEAIVAPRVGAWIETNQTVLTNGLVIVAPRVGAWIETDGIADLNGDVAVAPRVGAWIETL